MQTSDTQWIGAEAALIPENEGDTTILVCQRIGGKLIFVQRLYSNVEMKSSLAFQVMTLDLSKMIADMQRHATNVNRGS